MTGRAEALLAGALVATSGSILYVTAPLSGDGPAIALALVAVALACRYRARPSAAGAAGIGVAMGAALCVKLLVLPAAIPIAVVLIGLARRDRRWRDVAISVGAALAVVSRDGPAVGARARSGTSRSRTTATHGASGATGATPGR